MTKTLAPLYLQQRSILSSSLASRFKFTCLRNTVETKYGKTQIENNKRVYSIDATCLLHFA